MYVLMNKVYILSEAVFNKVYAFLLQYVLIPVAIYSHFLAYEEIFVKND